MESSSKAARTNLRLLRGATTGMRQRNQWDLVFNKDQMCS
jgi:hypothetical protein